MKKIYASLFFGVLVNFSVAQTIQLIDAKDYEKLKSTNSLDPNTEYLMKKKTDSKKETVFYGDTRLPQPNVEVNQTTDGSCNCMVPLDNTFQVVEFDDWDISPPEYRNDDASSTLITLPFDFCFYGQPRSDVYINNNGNLTFDQAYITFSSVAFPSSNYKMIAPFWGDVDTRGAASGLVYYKITNNYMIVKWENVGYFNSKTDKLNTFQLIISDGTDTLIPGNNNISFCYGDMQWTTGSASSGVNGFGGTPATVGVNKGDGSSFIQLGRFNAAGTAYDGPYNNSDGVSWLDNQNFNFNVCGSSTNLPPLAIGGNLSSCSTDTLEMCTNTDTLSFNTSFTGPENNQTVTVTVSAPTLGSAITSSSSIASGQTNSTFQVIGNAGLVGSHLITVTATDNGSPALSTTTSYVLVIPSVSLPPPVISVSPSGLLCGNIGATVSIDSCANYSNIAWSDGTNGCSIYLTQTDTIQVTVTAGAGCTKTSQRIITINPAPIVVLSGDTNFCNNNNTVLTANVSGITVPVSSYSWTNGGSAQTSTITAAGQVIVTVTDANGCVGKDTAIVTNITPPVTISSNVTSFCPGTPVTLTSSLTSGSFVWSGGTGGPYPNNSSIVVTLNTATTFSLEVTNNGCVSTDNITLSPLLVPTIDQFVQPSYCLGESTTITAVTNPSGATITWMPGGLTGATITPAVGVSTYSVTATVGTCTSVESTVTVQGPKQLPTTNIVDNLASDLDTILCYKIDKYLMHEGTSGGLAPYTYYWSPAASSVATKDSIKISQPGEYFLTVTDANGCKSTDSIEIDLIQPTLNISGTSLICPRTGSATIIAVGNSPNPFLLNWLPAGLGNNDTIITNQTGQYIATIIDSIYQCTATKAFTVGNYPLPNANFVVDPVPSEYGMPAVFTSTSTIPSGSISQHYWVFGDGDSTGTAATQTHIYDAPGIYPVKLYTKSNRGCWDTVVIEHEVIVVMPIINIITPNGDNVNNALKFKGLEFFPNSKIKIFNRWGNKIYENDNYQNDWDGKDFEDGTYYYILEVPKLKPQDNILSSFFQIIR